MLSARSHLTLMCIGIYPRYEVAPELDDITFNDPLFGEFYDINAEKLVSAEVVEHIASKLRQHIK
jgi:hypothetical protein